MYRKDTFDFLDPVGSRVLGEDLLVVEGVQTLSGDADGDMLGDSLHRNKYY